MLINRVSRFVRNPYFVVAFVLWIVFFLFGPRFVGRRAGGADEDLSNLPALPDLKRHWLLRARGHHAGSGEAAASVAAPPGAPPAQRPAPALPRHAQATGAGCRNSAQGAALIVDEQGFLCERRRVLASGCCPPQPPRRRFPCQSCTRHHCCAVFEYCVACCLNPNKRELLHRALRVAVDAVPPGAGHKVLLLTLADQFELCLAKCRTSSASVHHENQYRDPAAKHCYGPSPPMLTTTID